MLSIIPPVLPILKQPGLMPPTWLREKYKVGPSKLQAMGSGHETRLTVAGPMMATPFS